MTPQGVSDACILERPWMEHPPFGRWPDGGPIRDVSGIVVRANVEYLEELIAVSAGPEAGRGAVGRLCGLLNDRIRDPAYHVTPDFLTNVWHSYSYEFTAYLGEYCIRLSGKPDFQSAMAAEKFLPPLIQTLARPFSLRQIYGMFPHFGQKFAKGSLHFEVVRVGAGQATLRMRLADHVLRQFGPYRNACARLICQASKAGLAAVPKCVHGLPPARVVDGACLSSGSDHCEWTFTWEHRPERSPSSPLTGAVVASAVGLCVAWGLPAVLPGVGRADRVLAALCSAWTVWLMAASRRLWERSRRRERLLDEQLLAQEQKHEDLREAYLAQEQDAVELRRIAAENVALYQELNRAFEGFVQASVTAIESRDPVTSGHSNRVAMLSCNLAQAMDRADAGPFTSVRVSDEEMRELRYAALLHDFGKVAVREHVLLKAEKLLPEERTRLCARFAEIKHSLEREELRLRLAAACAPDAAAPPIAAGSDGDLVRRLRELDDMLAFILECSRPGAIGPDGMTRLRHIAGLHYHEEGERRPFLTEREVQSLSVPHGSLTPEDRREIERHVQATYDFLRAIPWSRALRNVPAIAFGHHEKLDGAGYPQGLSGEAIPLPTRMLTICDIYDALTARDRPYRKAVPAGVALDLLLGEAKLGKVDEHLFQLFVDAQVYKCLS